MKTKYWTIKFISMDGKTNYVHCIAMSVIAAIRWAIREYGISDTQIDYISGEEADMA